MNLSDSTKKIIFDVLTRHCDDTARAFHATDHERADAREAWERARSDSAAEGRLKRSLDRLVAETQAAEVAAREARWALIEYRRASGLDPDRDAEELGQETTCTTSRN